MNQRIVYKINARMEIYYIGMFGMIIISAYYYTVLKYSLTIPEVCLVE